MLAAVRERAQEYPVVEATPDCLVPPDGLDEDRLKAAATVKTPLRALLYELAGWNRLVFPRSTATSLDAAKLDSEVSAWHLDMIQRVNARLEPENEERRRKIADALARADERRPKTTRSTRPAVPIPAHSGSAPSAAPRSSERPSLPADSSPRSRRLIAGLALLGACLVIGILRWLKKRRPTGALRGSGS